jgi:hypothetical protein
METDEMNHYEWLKDHLTAIRNGGFTTKDLMNRSLISLDGAIQSAILAEREECAKACMRLYSSEQHEQYINLQNDNGNCGWCAGIEAAAAQIRARSQSALQFEIPKQSDLHQLHLIGQTQSQKAAVIQIPLEEPKPG